MNLITILFSFIIIFLSILITIISSLLFYNIYKNRNIERAKISKKQLIKAMIKLVHYSISFNPDYIICLNAGGLLIGAVLKVFLLLFSVKSKVKFKKCIIIENEIENEKNFENLLDVTGKILVVDSIVRTGKSMQSINQIINNNKVDRKNSYRKRKTISKNKIRNAVFITSVKKNGSLTYDNLHFYFYKTKNENLRLPLNLEEMFNSNKNEKYRKRKNEFEMIKKENELEIVKILIANLLPSYSSNI